EQQRGHRHLDQIATVVDQHVAAVFEQEVRADGAEKQGDEQCDTDTHQSGPAARLRSNDSERLMSGRGGAISMAASSTTRAAAARTPRSAGSKSRSSSPAAACRLAA